MKKSVITINDELGTIALGFSMAGYEVDAICLDQLSINSFQVCLDNWGSSTDIISMENGYIQDGLWNLNADCIAGKIVWGNSSDALEIGNVENDKGRIVKQAVCLLQEKRPQSFLFQSSRVNPSNPSFVQFCNEIMQMGYKMNYQYVDVGFVTGMPVKEKVWIMFGALESNGIRLEVPDGNKMMSGDLTDYFYDQNLPEDEWYYRVNPRYVHEAERYHENAVLCWSRDHYKEAETVSWNQRMIPLIAWGDRVRKMTEREIARLKGIPENYNLQVQNRGWQYEKLIYSANVLLIRQMALALSGDIKGNHVQNREVLKGEQFEKILISFFEKKGMVNVGEKQKDKAFADYCIYTLEKIYNFEFRIYRNNYNIKDKMTAVCDRLCSHERPDNEYNVIVVGNIVGKEIKRSLETKYKIIIWDVENILWMLDEFPQIKNDFISLLSFSVSDLVPQEPAQYIPGQKSQSKPVAETDLQERLQGIEPGKMMRTNMKKCVQKLCVIFFPIIWSFLKNRNGLTTVCTASITAAK